MLYSMCEAGGGGCDAMLGVWRRRRRRAAPRVRGAGAAAASPAGLLRCLATLALCEKHGSPGALQAMMVLGAASRQ
jgi:hypothetical protein